MAICLTLSLTSARCSASLETKAILGIYLGGRDCAQHAQSPEFDPWYWGKVRKQMTRVSES